MGKSKKMLIKGHNYNSATKSLMEKKEILVLLFFVFIPHIKFQDPNSNHS